MCGHAWTIIPREIRRKSTTTKTRQGVRQTSKKQACCRLCGQLCAFIRSHNNNNNHTHTASPGQPKSIYEIVAQPTQPKRSRSSPLQDISALLHRCPRMQNREKRTCCGHVNFNKPQKRSPSIISCSSERGRVVEAPHDDDVVHTHEFVCVCVRTRV